MTDTIARRPLQGITVIDLTRALAGPFATLWLGGLGADVIKVEDPDGGDFVRNNSPYYGANGLNLVRTDPSDISIGVIDRSRNKRSVTLNLKHPEAKRIFRDLVARADLVIENFSAGTADRLGVGYDYARSINPKVVYTSVSGFGKESTHGERAMDVLIQGLSGFMFTGGEEGDPPVMSGIPIADLLAGIVAVVGSLAALHQARETGQGQSVDVSMLGALTALVASEPGEALARLGVPWRSGRTKPRLAPFGVYQCSDGWISIAAGQEKWTLGFLRDVVGDPALAADVRFSSRDMRVRHSRELDDIVHVWSITTTVDDALAALGRAGIPCGKVRGPTEAVSDPSVLARGDTARLVHPALGEIPDIFGSGIPITFSDAVAELDTPCPILGEHNHAIYGDLLGYSAEEIARLHETGAI